jgi:hypothetical protein
VVIHLFPTVGAVQKPGKGIGNTDGVDALRRFAELLCKLPRLPVNNGFMGVLEDQPFVLRVFVTLVLSL